MPLLESGTGNTYITFLFLYNYGIILGCNAFSLGGSLIFHNADTDGSEDPDSGRMAAALYIPIFKTKIAKRISDHISVFTTKLFAIFLAQQWIEEIHRKRLEKCTDSMAALEWKICNTIRYMKYYTVCAE